MRRLPALGVVAALCALAAPSGAAAQTTCHVTANPGENLQTKVNALAAGQTLCLRAGVHQATQNVDVFAAKSNVRLQSYPGERATWRGRLRIQASGVVVQNLNLDGSGGPASSLPGSTQPSPVINGANVRLADNDIKNPKGICIVTNVDSVSQPTGFTIERNRIHNCRPRSNHIHGIYLAYARGGTIQDNVIYDNGDKGVMFYPDARNVTVQRNVIDGNTTGVHFAGDGTTASRDNLVINNIVANSNPRANVESHFPGPTGVNNRFEHNCVWANNITHSQFNTAGGIYTAGGGFAPDNNIQWDPPYHGRARKDFRILDSNHPCYGKQPPHSVGQDRADQQPRERLGALSGCGQFMATDQSVHDEQWVPLTDCASTKRVAVSDTLAGQINHCDSFATKEGGLSDAWFVHVPCPVVTSQIALAGSRLAKTNSCGELATKDYQGDPTWEIQSTCAQWNSTRISIAGDRLASLDSCGTLRMKDGGDGWRDLTGCGNKAVAVTTNPKRVAVVNSCGALVLKEGAWTEPFKATTTCSEDVQAFDLNGDRVAWVNGCGAVRTQEGVATAHDDPNISDKAPWAIERGCEWPTPKAIGISEHRIAIVTADNRLLVKEGGSGAAWRVALPSATQVSVPED